MESITEQLGWLEKKIDRALRGVSEIYGSLATGSTHARIHGAILVPNSVGTEVIAPGAITTTEIDDDSISTPKLQANAVTADKLTANLVLSGKIIGGTFSDPNVFGVELSTAGLKLFNGSGTQRGLLSVDGSGWLGTSTAFAWDTAGAVTATGITLQTNSAGAKVRINASGLQMLNASNQVNWELTSAGQRWYNATGSTQRGEILNDGSGWIGSSTGFSWNSSGAITATGVTVQSSSSTAKARLNSSGLQLFNSSGTQTADLNTNGSGFLGSGTPAISWTSGGSATINASTITTGTLNASSLTVTNFSASSITAGSLSFGSGGSLNGSGSYSGTLGGMSLANLTVSGTITLGSGGKIVDADGSEWSQTGIILKSTGTFGDAIKWNSSGSDIGSIYSSGSGFVFAHNSGPALSATSASIVLSANSAAILSLTTGGDANLWLGDAAGADAFRVQSNTSVVAFGVASNGTLLRGVADDTTSAGSYHSRIPIITPAGTKYLHVFNA